MNAPVCTIRGYLCCDIKQGDQKAMYVCTQTIAGDGMIVITKFRDD